MYNNLKKSSAKFILIYLAFFLNSLFFSILVFLYLRHNFFTELPLFESVIVVFLIYMVVEVVVYRLLSSSIKIASLEVVNYYLSFIKTEDNKHERI